MSIVAANAPGYRPAFQGPNLQTPRLNLDSLAPQGETTVRGVGFTILVCFLFMIFSRVFDMYLTKLHIPGIADRIMIVTIFLSGCFVRVFQNKIGKNLLFFTIWMALGIPFSIWRSQSLALLTGQWWGGMLVFMAVGGLIANYKQYRIAVTVTAVAIFVLTIFAMRYGTMETGRLFMANRSRFANPNDMAQALLIGIPFWLALSRKSASPLMKVLCGAVMLFMAYVIAKTGSRGAMISFGVLYLVMLYHANAIGKARLLLLAGLFVCASLAFLPTALKDRYKTLFNEDKIEATEAGEEGLLKSAVTSTESRQHLLRQSLILTATHPIFGVGVGQFSVAENELAVSQGQRKGSWLGTHNSYTQVASEMGLPAAFFFISVFFLCLKTTNSIYLVAKTHRELTEIAIQAEALFLALVCLAITDMFIHVAYTLLLPVMAGLTVAFMNAARPLIDEVTRRKAAQTMPAATVTRVYPPQRRYPARAVS